MPDPQSPIHAALPGGVRSQRQARPRPVAGVAAAAQPFLHHYRPKVAARVMRGLCAGYARAMSRDRRPDMSDSDWLTYPEAAVRLGVTPDAVRRRAFRRNWARRAGNDGRTRVLIPDDLVPHTDPTCAGNDRPDTSGTVFALQAHVETLKGELAAAKERTIGAEARAAVADARADKLAADLADMAAQMAGSVTAADARADTLIAELAGANERATAADARADRAVAELNALAQRMAAHLDPAPELEPPAHWLKRAWRWSRKRA